MPNWEAIPPQRLQLFCELFRHVGYRSPSMLDIANHVGISKKTLYTYVPNKEQLIVLCLEKKAAEYQQKHHQILDKQLSEKEELRAFFSLIWQFFKEFNANIIQDLSHHYPQAFEIYGTLRESLCEKLAHHYAQKVGYDKSQEPSFLAKLACHQIKEIAHKHFSVGDKSQQALLETFFEYNWQAITAKS